MAPRRATVWMIHRRTGRGGLKGVLELQPGALVFHPESLRTGESTIRLQEIRRVRRVRGTPVLEVALRTPNGLAVEILGFYFVKPPSLAEPEDVRMRIFRRHVARRRAVTALRTANLDRKDDIAGWVDAIRRAGNAVEPDDGR